MTHGCVCSGHGWQTPHGRLPNHSIAAFFALTGILFRPHWNLFRPHLEPSSHSLGTFFAFFALTGNLFRPHAFFALTWNLLRSHWEPSSPSSPSLGTFFALTPSLPSLGTFFALTRTFFAFFALAGNLFRPPAFFWKRPKAEAEQSAMTNSSASSYTEYILYSPHYGKLQCHPAHKIELRACL